MRRHTICLMAFVHRELTTPLFTHERKETQLELENHCNFEEKSATLNSFSCVKFGEREKCHNNTKVSVGE